MPKSGEQDDQTAPMLVAASIATTASGTFGRKPTTRSPATTPAARSPDAIRATSDSSLRRVSERRRAGSACARSSQAMRAGPSSWKCSRFSA